MSVPHGIYSREALNALRNHGRLIQELSKEIRRVLETDPEIKNLILERTAAKYAELKDKADKDHG